MKKKAIFLDRDGVMNKEVHYLSSPSQLRLIRGCGKAIILLNKLGFIIIVITNQEHISKGLLTEEGLLDIHAELRKRVERHGGTIHAFHYCPHRLDASLLRYKKGVGAENHSLVC